MRGWQVPTGAAWLLAGLLAAAAPQAAAQSGAPEPPATAPTPDLYQEALLSIAEGRKNDASATLSRLVDQEPLHAGAWLELALIQCSLGHADEAERLFAAIESRFQPPPGIIELITQARRNGCARWDANAVFSFSLARGIDQNANQGSSSPTYTIAPGGVPTEYPLAADFLPKHDQYTQISGDYLRDISANGSTMFAQFQARRNDRLSQYSSASLFAGVDTPWRFGKWTARTSATAGLITLGGQLYQRQVQVQARVGAPIPLPGNTQFSVLTGITHVDYVTLSNFDANTGELRGMLNYRAEHGSARASFAVLDDRARGDRPGGNRHGISANLSLRHSLGTLLSGELGVSKQTWRSASLYAPNVIDVARRQDTVVLSASVSYPVTRNQAVQLEARQVKNRENISIFQYNDRQLQLSWQWQGP